MTQRRVPLVDMIVSLGTEIFGTKKSMTLFLHLNLESSLMMCVMFVIVSPFSD